jgi:hypothetical protein
VKSFVRGQWDDFDFVGGDAVSFQDLAARERTDRNDLDSASYGETDFLGKGGRKLVCSNIVEFLKNEIANGDDAFCPQIPWDIEIGAKPEIDVIFPGGHGGQDIFPKRLAGPSLRKSQYDFLGISPKGIPFIGALVVIEERIGIVGVDPQHGFK